MNPETALLTAFPALQELVIVGEFTPTTDIRFYVRSLSASQLSISQNSDAPLSIRLETSKWQHD